MRAWAIALVAVAGATVFLHAPIFEGLVTGEPRFFEWDVPEQYWPDLVYLCDALHDGELPYWNPYDRGGYPYYADPQASIYHPLNWMICGVAGRSPSMDWAIARTVSAFFLCGVFALLWLRRLDVPWGGVILGAVAMQAAPFMRHNWELNLTTALAYLPLMLWAADRAVVLRRARDGALLALATALCAWVGSPPALYFAGSFTALYVAARLAVEHRRHGRSVLRPAFFALGVAALLSAGLIAVVIVPGLGLAEHSVQHGRSFASIAEGALAPGDLVALGWPQPGNHLYVGALVLALAVLAVTRRRLLPLFFAAVAILAVLLCLGESTPVFRAAFELLPGARLFRLPHRYESWLGPSMAALAALGVAELIRRFPDNRAARFVASGTGGALLSLVLLVDVSRALPPERHTRATERPGNAADAARLLPLAPDTDARYRYFDEFGIGCRSGTRLGRRDFRGYQDPLLLAAYERVVGSLAETPDLLGQFNVRYVLTGPHFIHGDDRRYLPTREVLLSLEDAADRGEGVVELGHTLPFAYWTAEAVEVEDRQEALERLRPLASAPVAFVEGSIETRPVANPPSPTPADAVVLRRDSLSFLIAAPRQGVVVVNEAFYPGWHARVSGVEVPIHRANALVRGIEVPEGRHRIEMFFRPEDGPPLRWLLLFSLLITVGLLSAPLWTRYKARPWRHRTADPPGA